MKLPTSKLPPSLPEGKTVVDFDGLKTERLEGGRFDVDYVVFTPKNGNPFKVPISVAQDVAKQAQKGRKSCVIRRSGTGAKDTKYLVSED